jgi:hypothetical protein
MCIKPSPYTHTSTHSGKIATWNLTLHYLNPTMLIHVGNDFEGFHLREDPGIVSLAFHDRTKTCFSGGNDCSVSLHIYIIIFKHVITYTH